MKNNIKTFENFIKSERKLAHNSFSELSTADLYDIAKWSIYDGGYNLYDDLSDSDAIDEIVNDFQLLLSEDFPNGFRNTPPILPLYRIVKLESLEELDKMNLGTCWFGDITRIDDDYFMDQLFNKSNNLYLIKADIPISKIDIPRSLVQRIMSYIENEVVLTDDNNIEIISSEKIR